MKTRLPEIVLIEMDEITLELYRRELSKSFTVHAFTEMEQALQAVTQRNIRAVVIEPELQQGRGWDFIREIRRNCPERSIPIVVCSTREPDSKHTSAEVTQYLTKPVLPNTLREKILQVIAGQ